MAREKVLAEERLQQQLGQLRDTLENDHRTVVEGLNNEINEAQVDTTPPPFHTC